MKCGLQYEFCNYWSRKNGKCGKPLGECGCYNKI